VTDRPPDVRASDTDRERIAEQLSRHAAAGRLSAEELNERLDTAYAARTHGELAPLTADLPDDPAVAGPAPDPGRELAKRRLAHRAGAALMPIGLCIAIWAASGASGSFWPVWVIIACAVGLARDGWRVLGPGRDLSDEELGIDRRHDRARRRP
jgi:CubicO group peptidase (beta-lactamase class C family)